MVGSVEIVMKISKYCNLRCSYCYELSELDQKRRMSLELIEDIFRNIRASLDDRTPVDFIWHGGEPLLVPLEHYFAIADLQRRVFGARPVANALQTNLTVLTPRHVEFLRSRRFFSMISVSCDVYGSHRADLAGRDSTPVVLRNFELLRSEGIEVGAIAVLTRGTLPFVREIFRFFDQLHTHCRFLPFYRHDNEGQSADHAISFDEYLNAMLELFDAWLHSRSAPQVDPLMDYIGYAVAHLNGRTAEPFDTSNGVVLVVDTDGQTWGQEAAYVEGCEYGNLAQQPLSLLLASKARRVDVDRVQRNTAAHCRNCPYRGCCPGDFVSGITLDQQEELNRFGCPVRIFLDRAIPELSGQFSQMGNG